MPWDCWHEFKKFAMRGNVVDMAVGIVIGGAFGKIVTSLVNDVIMPVVGKLTGGVDFSKMAIYAAGGDDRRADSVEVPAVEICDRGRSSTRSIDFIDRGVCDFHGGQGDEHGRERLETERRRRPPPAPPEDILLLREIRDSLAKR